MQDTTELKKKYSLLEQRLYADEYAASTQFERWKDQPVTKLAASELGTCEVVCVYCLLIGLCTTPITAQLDEPALPGDVERDQKRLKNH
jgi:hypothetical protein